MALRSGQFETEVVSQSQKRAEIVIGQALGTKPECVVDVHQSRVFATVTMADTATLVSFVVGSLMGRNPGPVHPSNGPHKPLRGERRPSIPETEGGVEVYESVPLNSEERDIAGVEEEPAVPARHI